MILLTIITTISTIFIICFSSNQSFIFKLSNAFFIIGFIYLFIALSIHVRNIGFFKTLSYNKYRRNYKKLTELNLTDEELNNNNNGPKKFYDFFVEKYKRQISNALFYKFAIPLILVSFILSFI
ncbi:DUF3899 domain-containing protein [Alkaliphilus sp. MSJ-5]|uniref:DUF3899 domain-containing protein n=1 Tax=Alkaliphilus flagellatus TaxID=2841507 RepID=A0ABS6FYI4_9FIRM|nr:DUF3899 domain-containing protein [Alkaliphilus flagellatus]MBU5674966.1 DUF3899 domain-containing protein [Alkaliphilus flagellatus]